MASLEESQIRKYRKKLRQIEHLESIHRPLTEEEKNKVLLKTAIRKELQKLLSQLKHECAVENSNEIVDNDDYNDEDDENESDEETLEVILSVEEMKRESEEAQNRHNEDKRLKTESPPRSSKESSSSSNNAAKQQTLVREPSPESADKKKIKNLRNYKIVRRELEGHSDIVWCISIDNEYVISGSRDTTARVWDAKTGEEVCSLRGHTDSVNGVAFLPKEKGEELLRNEGDNENSARKIAISASTDCSVRLWLVPQGELLKSIYTFNSITCLALMPDFFYSVTGTDGGKIEMYNMSTGQIAQSVIAYENSLSCLEANGLQICSGSVDGIVKIWLLRDNSLTVIYTLDPSIDITNPRNSLRHLKSLCSKDGNIFMGDEGLNLKVLNWKRGQIHQIKNHLSKYGCTDTVHSHRELLVCSSYNLDTGSGSVNVRLLPEGEYVCSLPEIFSRILCLAITDGDEVCDYRLATGGLRLFVWDLIDPTQKTALRRLKEEDCKIYGASYRSAMLAKAEITSSEEEFSDDDEVVTEECTEGKPTELPIVPMKENSLWNYCHIL